MNENEMLESLELLKKNLSTNGDKTIYKKMLVLLDDIRYFLYYDLQIDYPKEYYENIREIKEGSFDF